MVASFVSNNIYNTDYDKNTNSLKLDSVVYVKCG